MDFRARFVSLAGRADRGGRPDVPALRDAGRPVCDDRACGRPRASRWRRRPRSGAAAGRRPSPNRSPRGRRRRAAASAWLANPTSITVAPSRPFSSDDGPLGDDDSVVDDHDAVGQAVGLLEVLRREQHGGPGATSSSITPHSSVRLLRVEPGGRLVEEQHRRPVHERRREVEPAPHAARVGAHQTVGGVGQVEPFEQVVAPRGDDRGLADA